ncbi:hypothetical protein LOTGIDRAFT_218124 [Lottia gigantea]|uniref:Mammalian ependymin-related protein 1 n=1 Tax=Lottia gigantea TaxID=225164 RepID=V4A9W0_LOTGI|nr:hypothetical protein LOTGIDRAFT_218124 [Lottia gigantea]ESO90086.1 hypothetical protein LOTGIDRAFT_218124 [Lottia gigantea]
MKVLLVFCVAVVSVLSQTPNPCVSPKQWEGRLFRYDRSKNFLQRARISYDELDRRVREVEEIEIGQTRDYYDVLYLHNIGIEYRLNFRTKNCTITPLTRPFIPAGLPEDAKYRGEATIGPAGVPDEHLTAVLFDGEFEGNPYFGAVTYPSCAPIETGFYSNRTGTVHSTYFDITLGITDPSVFIPPSECTS